MDLSRWHCHWTLIFQLRIPGTFVRQCRGQGRAVAPQWVWEHPSVDGHRGRVTHCCLQQKPGQGLEVSLISVLYSRFQLQPSPPSRSHLNDADSLLQWLSQGALTLWPHTDPSTTAPPLLLAERERGLWNWHLEGGKQMEVKQGAKAYVRLDLPKWWRKSSLMFSSEKQLFHSIHVFKYMIILMISHGLKSFDCQETPKCFHFVIYGFLTEKLENQRRLQK